MTVKVSRPSIDIRGTLDELNKPSGIAGNAMLAAETPQEQFNLIGAGRKNLIINGGFDVWQRGTSFTPTGADYMADRWFMGGGDYACTVTKQASTLPDGSEVNTMLISYTATGTNAVDPYQGIEDYKVLSGKTIAISCWVRTNISGLKFRQYSTANFGSDAVPDGQWNKLVTTVTLGAVTSTNKVANSSFFGLVSGGAIVTKSGDYLEMTQFQLELGSVATPFEHRSYGEELALCQRYYETSFAHGVTPSNGPNSTSLVSDWMTGIASNRSNASATIFFKVRKRVAPMLNGYGASNGYLGYKNMTDATDFAWNQSSVVVRAATQVGFMLSQGFSNGNSFYIQFHYTADAELY